MNSTSPLPSADVFPQAGSSLYYSLRTAPAGRGPALRLWMQWWHETATIPFKIHDPGVAETKLRWWLQELQDAAKGQAHHPLIKALQSEKGTQDAGLLPPWPLWACQIEGLLTLVHQTRWLDDASFQRHAQQTTGAACEGAACLLGAQSELARQAARQLGWGMRQAHRLARIGQDARAGWVQLGIDVLQAHDVKAHQLSKPDRAQPPEGWAGLLAHLHRQASDTIQSGLAASRGLSAAEARALLPIRVQAHLHLQLINEIATQGDRVLHERIVLTPLRKWWLAQGVKWGLLR